MVTVEVALIIITLPVAAGALRLNILTLLLFPAHNHTQLALLARLPVLPLLVPQA
jgi:hypothetical protein